MQNLRALLKTLLEHKVDFVLIGGFAAVVHGSTLVTQDIDICCAISNDEIGKLRMALKDYHPVHRMNPNFTPSFLDYPIEFEGVKNIYLKTDLGVLDILSETRPAGDFFDLKARAIEIPLYGYICKVISIDDLIKVKSSMKRPKDLQVVEELNLIKKSEN